MKARQALFFFPYAEAISKLNFKLISPFSWIYFILVPSVLTLSTQSLLF